METPRFQIVFEKLAEAVGMESGDESAVVVTRAVAEFNEIDELRRLALEIAEPEPMTYTTT
ncbi:MAG: hypothetical protein ACYC4P_20570 [Thermoanaerobaculia bacterium]